MDQEECPEIVKRLRSLCSSIPGGSQLLALLRLVWRWARPGSPASRSRVAKNCKNGNASPAKNCKNGNASPSKTSDDVSLPDNASRCSSSDAFSLPDNATFSSSPTSARAENIDGDPSSPAPNIAVASSRSSSAKDADAAKTGSSNIHAHPSSIAANTTASGGQPSIRTARTWLGTSTPTLFHVNCRRCGWTDRVAFPVLAAHLNRCGHRRYDMEQRMAEGRAENRARAAERRSRRRR